MNRKQITFLAFVVLQPCILLADDRLTLYDRNQRWRAWEQEAPDYFQPYDRNCHECGQCDCQQHNRCHGQPMTHRGYIEDPELAPPE